MFLSIIFGLAALSLVAWAIVEAGRAEFADDPTRPRRMCHALGAIAVIVAFAAGVMT